MRGADLRRNCEGNIFWIKFIVDMLDGLSVSGDVLGIAECVEMTTEEMGYIWSVRVIYASNKGL